MVPKVQVVATTSDGTRAALLAAVPLARGLNATLTIVVPCIVSCAAELAVPAPATDLVAKRYQDFARGLGAEAGIDAFTSVGLDDLVAHVCAGTGPVVVGGPVGRWLTSPEERFANRLARAGCHVVFVASGANATQRRVAA
ncbi:MAG TPA: hypothetical protein VFA59_09965 [Vicinamibacterales bacterium]|nr:hypothetical protein [Vicinamibacterales bacterium]